MHGMVHGGGNDGVQCGGALATAPEPLTKGIDVHHPVRAPCAKLNPYRSHVGTGECVRQRKGCHPPVEGPPWCTPCTGGRRRGLLRRLGRALRLILGWGV